MPQDPNLYGQRPGKRKRTEAVGLASSLDFASQLQSIISASTTPAAATAAAKTRRPRNDDDADLARVRVKKRATRDGEAEEEQDGKGKKPSLAKKTKPLPWGKKNSSADGNSASAPLDANELEKIHERLSAKARLYAALQRGDHTAREGERAPLVDFDRKWAEQAERRSRSKSRDDDNSSGGGDSSDDSSDDAHGSDSGADTEMVELTDEFGRSRMVPRRVRDRALRRRARAERAAAELAEMRARPQPAAELIYGDVIQTEAIETAWDRRRAAGDATGDGGGGDDDGDDGVKDTHYRAEEDVRTRGAAFYALAADDEARRAAQLQALADARAATEAARADRGTARASQTAARDAELAARRAQLAARREQVAAQRAQRAQVQADRFLDRLGADLAGEAEGGADATAQPDSPGHQPKKPPETTDGQAD